jgi:hypothetical protein
MRARLALLVAVLAVAGFARTASACKVVGSGGPPPPEVAQRMCDEFGARLEHESYEAFVAEREATRWRASVRNRAEAIMMWVEDTSQVTHSYGAALVSGAVAMLVVRRRRRRLGSRA